MLIEGSCHCKNISFALTWPGEPEEIPARACACTFCLKHAGVWTANPHATLQVKIQNSTAIARYSFATKTAQFHLCTQCGVVPFVTSTIEGHLYAVVNVHTFDHLEQSMLKHSAVTFDGEDEGARLARRAKNWIAAVDIV